MRTPEIRTLAGAHGLIVSADRFSTTLHDVEVSSASSDDRTLAHPGGSAAHELVDVVAGRSAGGYGGAACRSDVERLLQREEIRVVQRRKAHRRARRLGHRIF